jgi:putative Holliday junction resolvase
MAIDFGLRRCGLAVTDELQIISTPLETIESKKLDDYLKKYFQNEKVDTIVLGKSLHLDGSENVLFNNVLELKKHLDERYTSKMALQTMIDGGMKKKDRKNKENIDLISAVLILQTYMQTINK